MSSSGALSQQPFWQFSSRTRPRHEPHPVTSERRESVLNLFASGATVNAIAASLDIDETTVTKHLRAAKKALDPRATRSVLRLVPSTAGAGG